MVDRVDAYRVTGVLARVGYVGRGITFVLVGTLGARLATGDPTGEASGLGAIALVDRQPLGSYLLTAITVAIVAYAGYSLAEAVGATRSGATNRVAAAARALAWAGLATLAAVQVFEFRAVEASGDAPQALTARLLGLPGGRVLVALVGAVVVAIAVNELRKSWQKDWEEELGSVGGSEGARRIAYLLGRIGYAARGVAYGLVGWFFLVSAWQDDPDESGGLDAALTQTASTGWGMVALWAIAAGFVAYGLFCFFIARYRKD